MPFSLAADMSPLMYNNGISIIRDTARPHGVSGAIDTRPLYDACRRCFITPAPKSERVADAATPMMPPLMFYAATLRFLFH